MKTQQVSILFFLFLLLVACTQQQTEQTSDHNDMVLNQPSATEPAQAQQTPQQIIPQQAPLKEFNVEAFQFGFEPSQINVNKGDHVRIHLTTRDVTHSFTIDEFGVNIPTAADEPGIGDFIADKTGTFTYYCNIPCGSGHKHMQGTLVVT